MSELSAILAKAEAVLRGGADEFPVSARKPWFQTLGIVSDKAHHFVPLITPHEVFAAPFCGRGEPLYFKDPSPQDWLTDIDKTIIRLHTFAKNQTPEQIAALKRKNWHGSKAYFDQLRKTDPQDDIGWLHRQLYLRAFNAGSVKNPSFRPSDNGRVLNPWPRLAYAKVRYAKVHLKREDYKETFRRLDAKDTFFFIDPPYFDAGGAASEVYYDQGGPTPKDMAGVFTSCKGKVMMITTGNAPTMRPFTDKMYHKTFRWPIRMATINVRNRAFRTGWIVTNYTAKTMHKALTLTVQVPDVPWAVLDKDRRSSGSGVTYEEESTLIRANQKRPEAARPHPFTPAEWTHPNGHPRCLLCGDEERIGGMCSGVRKAYHVDPAEVHEGSRWDPATLQDTPTDKGIQVWDPDHADPDADRQDLRPLAMFQPMDPASGAANAFDTAEEAVRDFASPGALATGIAVEPAYKGVRVVVQKAGDRVMMYTADRWQDFSDALPGVSKDLHDMPGDFVLDAKLMAHGRQAEDLVRYSGQADDRGVLIMASHALHLPDSGNLTAQPYDTVRKALAGYLAGCTRDHIRATPYRVAHTEEALRDAIGWAAGQPGSEGAVLKIVSSTYSLGGVCDGWAMCKAADMSGTVDSLPPRNLRLIPGYVEKAGDEQYVLGIVLVPEEEDAQGDIYSHDEVRQAAHDYLAKWRNRGYQHRVPVNDKVDLVESYIAPVDFTLDGQRIKRGTWMAAMHIKDPALWAEVKRGEITGFSIGGSAEREAA